MEHKIKIFGVTDDIEKNKAQIKRISDKLDKIVKIITHDNIKELMDSMYSILYNSQLNIRNSSTKEECIICMNNEVSDNLVLLCGHNQLCDICIHKISSCPTCRKKAEIMKIFR